MKKASVVKSHTFWQHKTYLPEVRVKNASSITELVFKEEFH